MLISDQEKNQFVLKKNTLIIHNNRYNPLFLALKSIIFDMIIHYNTFLLK